MATTTVAPVHSRARRILIFFAVVWSVGAAFLALDASLTELSWFSASTSLPANIVLPRQSQAAFLHCQEVLKHLPPPAQDAGVSRQAWYPAWRLGYLLGSADASMTSGVVDRATVENAIRQSLAVTNVLGIPPLALPQHRRSAYALREFAESLEEDPPCVAAAFQFRHTPRHAALYKFGATVGFVSTYRRMVPQLNDVLTPELRLYGSAAGIPAELYAPLLGPSTAGPNAISGLVVQTVKRIDVYIRSTY